MEVSETVLQSVIDHNKSEAYSRGYQNGYKNGQREALHILTKIYENRTEPDKVLILIERGYKEFKEEAERKRWGTGDAP